MRARRRTVRASCTCLALALAAGSSVAAPEIVPTAQARSTSANAFAADFKDSLGDSDGQTAPDFAPFSSAVSAEAALPGGQGTGGGIQNSTIGTDRIVATGSAFATGESYDFKASADGSGSSRVSVDFALTEGGSFRLRGFVNAYDNGFALINLRDAGGDVFGEFASGPAEERPFDVSGALAAGAYTLEIEAEGSAFGASFNSDYAFAEFDVELLVGVPGAGGEVPDGADVPGPAPLTALRLADGRVRLQWSPSCRIDDVDFEVYEGQVGDAGSFGQVACSTSGRLQFDVTPFHDAAAFLVVPTDGTTEGSYGDRSDDSERLPSTSACRPQSLGGPICP